MPAKDDMLRSPDESGFTLLELIVVCTLIGLMLSFSIPSLRMTLLSDPLKGAARSLIGLTNGVRQVAIRQQQPYLLHIDEAEKRIWYEKETGSERGEELEKGQGKELRLPESVSIAGVWVAQEKQAQDQTTLWISRQGYMERAGIGLEDEDGNRLVVQFYPFLDAATVAEDEP